MPEVPRPWRPRQGADGGGSHRFRGRGKDFIDLSILGRNVAVNLVPVGVVVSEGRVDLRQCEVFDLGGDLFGSQAQVVLPGNPPDRDTGPGDARPAFADLWRSLDQSSNIDCNGHSCRLPFC